MTLLDETVDQENNQMSAALGQGVKTISLDQEITFTRYIKLVLPIDGFVFWVKADLVSQSALFNTSPLNTFVLNQSEKITTPATTLTVQGSLHYATEMQQEEEETYTKNRVVFTALHEVQNLNRISPDELFITTVDEIQVAFSARGSFYKQADLFHYVGHAVYSDMYPQIISSMKDFSNKQVVTNSLPIWLAMNNYAPQPWEMFGNAIRLYPSYLSPANLVPPFATIHIEPNETRAIAAAPTFNNVMTHRQLCADRVIVTLWGVRNDQALDFVDFVQQQALNTEIFGIMNMPTIRDDKRPQSELNAISQKKSVAFDINYYQERVNSLARQLILEAIPTYYVGEQVVA